MIKHLMKMVWNRKRVNSLIIVEIFFSFLVLFAVILFAVYYTDNYRHPLGFSYENVWNIEIQRNTDQPGAYSNTQNVQDQKAPPSTNTKQLFLALSDFYEIESMAGAMTTPYSFSTSQSAYDYKGRIITFQINEVTDSFKDTMSLDLVRGRWFSREDDGANYNPVVINERLSREMFGDEDPVGKNIAPETDPDGEPVKREERVVGVVTDFRKDGEYSPLINYVFERKDIGRAKDTPPRNILIKVRPDTTAAFEEKLIARLQGVAKDWSFEIQPLTQMRETGLTVYLAPIIAASLVAGFLMIMVALGLTGVLWQNVTQRTKEIGLRRAKGATAGRIHMQILGELVVITSFGLLLGVLIVAQFPLLDLIGYISGRVYAYSLLLSLVLIYLLTIICGLYPSRLATKVQPAQALHYE